MFVNITDAKLLSLQQVSIIQFLSIVTSFTLQALQPLIRYTLLKKIMEKRVLGIILSLLGIAGLIYAGVSFLNGGEGTRNIKAIIFTGVLGAIFFFAGIGLIRNTKDKAT